MPFKSLKQQRYLWANKPEIAKEWSQKYNSGGLLYDNNAINMQSSQQKYGGDEMMENMDRNNLTNQFVMTIQRQGVNAGRQMLNQYRSELTPDEIAFAEDVLMRAQRVQGIPKGFNMGGEIDQYNKGGMIDPAKKGTFKAQATRMGMGVQEAADTILRAPEGRYSPTMRRKANFAKNFGHNTGGLIGDTPRYNEGGMLMNHPYNREGEQFDTVPAMLTPGEFVVDADSAHRFGDELEKINDWEPSMVQGEASEEGLTTREDEDIKIERKFKDGTKITVHSPQGSKAEISGLLSSIVDVAEDEHGLLSDKNMNRGGVLYANTGTQVPNPFNQINQQIDNIRGVNQNVTPLEAAQAQGNAQQMLGQGFNLLSNASGQSVASNIGNQFIQQGIRTATPPEGSEGTISQQILTLLQQSNPQLVGKPAEGGV